MDGLCALRRTRAGNAPGVAPAETAGDGDVKATGGCANLRILTAASSNGGIRRCSLARLVPGNSGIKAPDGRYPAILYNIQDK